MTDNASIYDYIKASIVEGELPEEFTLCAGEDDESTGGFIDGALDGVDIFVFGCKDVDDEALEDINNALVNVLEGNDDQASQEFDKLFERFSLLDIIEHVQDALASLAASYKLRPVFDYACNLLQASCDKEMVKLGLAILEPFGEQEATPKDVIRTLGACDEFTLYCAKCARRWENGNDELFSLAKAAHGWGRIHCVEMLEPETEEIRQWLLHEGAFNNVMTEYSALTCILKADLANVLESPLTQEEFIAVSSLIEAACDLSSPVELLPFVEGGERILNLYLDYVSTMQIDLGTVYCIYNILLASEDEYRTSNPEGIIARCKQLLEREDTIQAVTKNIGTMEGDYMAGLLGLIEENEA